MAGANEAAGIMPRSLQILFPGASSTHLTGQHTLVMASGGWVGQETRWGRGGQLELRGSGIRGCGWPDVG